MKDEIGSLNGFIEIEGGYKDDIIRIVSKMHEYKQEGEQKPWMKINDGVRMAIKVKKAEEAFDITKKIMQALLNNTSVIKIDSKLTKPHLRNVTIHGFNFKKGIRNRERGYFHLVGAEI